MKFKIERLLGIPRHEFQDSIYYEHTKGSKKEASGFDMIYLGSTKRPRITHSQGHSTDIIPARHYANFIGEILNESGDFCKTPNLEISLKPFLEKYFVQNNKKNITSKLLPIFDSAVFELNDVAKKLMSKNNPLIIDVKHMEGATVKVIPIDYMQIYEVLKPSNYY